MPLLSTRTNSSGKSTEYPQVGEFNNSAKQQNIDNINKFIQISAILSIAFYITYVIDENTILRTGAQYLYVTVIPFTLIIYRLLLLIDTKTIDDDPIQYIEQDNTTKILIILYLLILAFVLVF